MSPCHGLSDVLAADDVFVLFFLVVCSACVQTDKVAKGTRPTTNTANQKMKQCYPTKLKH